MHDLNDALIFAKVVEHGSFSAAARALRQPKSTVSRRVQELEARLDVQLLHRTTRRLGLTEAGSIFYEHCRAIGLRLEEATHAVASLQARPRGWLRVAASSTVASSWVAPLLGEFHARCPEIQIELALSDQRLDLIAEELDIALYVGDLPDSSLVARRLARFQTRVYASPDYLRRHGEPRHAAQLSEHRVLALTTQRRGNGYEWPLHGDGGLERIPVRPLLACNDASLLHGPLLAGQGLLLACAFSMRPYLDSGVVREVLPGWRGPELALHAVFPRGRPLSPKVRAFVDFLVERLDVSSSTRRARPAQAPGTSTTRAA